MEYTSSLLGIRVLGNAHKIENVEMKYKGPEGRGWCLWNKMKQRERKVQSFSNLTLL